MQVPSLLDDRVLRHVEIDGRYRLLLWDTNRRDRYGKSTLGYAFSRIGESEPIFSAEDYHVPGCVDDDAAVRGLLGFLTLRGGDTDSDYFANYTERQWAFSRGDAEEISCWGMDEHDLEGSYPLVDVDETPAPLARLEGWHDTQTGGGCTAWQIDLPGGRYALITDGDASIPTHEGDLVIGLYSDEGDAIADESCSTLAECLAWFSLNKDRV